MKNFELIKQGAEAKLYQGTYLGKPAIAKQRFAKKYRHPSLDSSLTKERITAENRALIRCKIAGIRTPAVYAVNLAENTIYMEHVLHSKTAKDLIEDYSRSNDHSRLQEFFYHIGKTVGKLHENNIIHGDLTSSNILVVSKHNPQTLENCNPSDLIIVPIDFGLSRIQSSAEDKGVDLYVLERALISTHSLAEESFEHFLSGYQAQYTNGSKEVLHKYDEIKLRGRKRVLIGI
ncbi:unnamed protein product [Phyllotreta striolata]|uniref:non-specific serine/threonine protein kinase n=1 Tax=Phyllotreta striolata TaxID=444603 RepID=A0A9N9TTW0_PHYSR|nr:unnamed protein product [Phyllotreta striolata]